MYDEESVFWMTAPYSRIQDLASVIKQSKEVVVIRLK